MFDQPKEDSAQFIFDEGCKALFSTKTMPTELVELGASSLLGMLMTHDELVISDTTMLQLQQSLRKAALAAIFDTISHCCQTGVIDDLRSKIKEALQKRAENN